MSRKIDMIKELRDELIRFVAECAANWHPDSRSRYFDEPLLGCADATDSLFGSYKQIIGEHHLTPRELMETALPGKQFASGTVLCWILPITEATRASNRRQRLWPSREWAFTRTHGEAFNNAVRQHLTEFLLARGHQAVAPLLSASWRTVATADGLSSTWSERHAAFAAGLGTFSLNRGFITERGIAHRCGSIITDLVLTPSPRRYRDFAENCLFCRDGSCGACISRCPAGAITRFGHDKERCRIYCYEKVVREIGERYGVSAPGCGLCQTGVPCEARIP
ncbi:MAG: epoxyqueuosine reductase [Geobacteraceae bacterium]|nr:epoxyqueuosine reductase [Geobacteraceae bacterium]